MRAEARSVLMAKAVISRKWLLFGVGRSFVLILVDRFRTAFIGCRFATVPLFSSIVTSKNFSAYYAVPPCD